MSFSQGDNVESAVKISGSFFSQGVLAGTPGVAINANWTGAMPTYRFL